MRGAFSGCVRFGNMAAHTKVYRNSTNILWPAIVQTANASVAVDGYFVQDDRLIFGRSDDERHRIADQILCDPLEWVKKVQNGCFNIVINDRRSRRTLILNDRFGFLPLYIHRNNSGLWYASDLAELRSVSPDLLEIDPLGLAELYRFGYQIGERSPYRNVSLLAPGCMLTVAWDQGLEECTPWAKKPTHADSTRNIDINAVPYQLRDLVNHACARLHSGTENYGIKLSGGLDSRFIAACWPHRPLRSYTWGDRRSKEIELAARLAGRLRLQHRQIDIEGDFFPRIHSAMFDEHGIMEFLHEIATPYIIADKVDLVLDGLVGDVFVGGGYYDDARKQSAGDLLHSAFGYRHPHIRFRGSNDELAEKVRRLIDVADVDFPILCSDARDEIERLTDDILHDIAQVTAHLTDPEVTLESAVHRFMLHCRTRRYTALQGTTNRPAIQTLYPFLDTDLLEYLATVPTQLFQYRELYRLAYTHALPSIRDIPATRSGIPFHGPRVVHSIARVIRGSIERLGMHISLATAGRINVGIVDAIQWERWLAENEAFRSAIQDQFAHNPLIDTKILGQTLNAVARRKHFVSGTRLMLTASYCQWFQPGHH